MKVLFFLGFPNPFPGAGWTRIGFFAKHFKDRGYKVAVIGIFSPKSLKMAGFRSWKGIPIYNVIPTLWIENVFALIFNVLSSMILAPVIFLALKPKVVILSLPTGEPTLGAYFASRFSHAKIVFDVRDEWENYVIGKASSKAFKKVYKMLKTLMASLYDKADLVVAVTYPIARSLMLRGANRVRIVPNGADVNVFRPYEKDVTRIKLRLKNDDFIIVYEGGVGGYYRLDVVVRALARLDNEVRSKMRLLIVGSGDVPNLLVLAERLGLKDNVIYLGVENDKVAIAQIISAGDVGIVPYDANPLWKDHVPAKFYEYCACGIPVIATVYNDSLLAKLIKEYGIGLTVSPMDSEKLAEAIFKMYQRPEFKRLGRKSRALIEKKFDRCKIAEKFLSMIKQIV